MHGHWRVLEGLVGSHGIVVLLVSQHNQGTYSSVCSQWAMITYYLPLQTTTKLEYLRKRIGKVINPSYWASAIRAYSRSLFGAELACLSSHNRDMQCIYHIKWAAGDVFEQLHLTGALWDSLPCVIETDALHHWWHPAVINVPRCRLQSTKLFVLRRTVAPWNPLPPGVSESKTVVLKGNCSPSESMYFLISLNRILA